MVKDWDAFEPGHCGHRVLVHEDAVTDGPPAVVLKALIPAICATQANTAIWFGVLTARPRGRYGLKEVSRYTALVQVEPLIV